MVKIKGNILGILIVAYSRVIEVCDYNDDSWEKIHNINKNNFYFAQ